MLFLLKKSVSVSQAGQDLWVFSEVFNEKRNGYFLDIGAHDGVYLSNTFLLEKRYGWKGICIEANPSTFHETKANRSCKCINACVGDGVSEVSFYPNGVMGGVEKVRENCHNAPLKLKTVSLNDILEKYNAPKLIDYLSIDIEGYEEKAMESLDLNTFTFNCITIERPTLKLRKRLEEYGYIVVKEIPQLDVFLVHQSHLESYRSNLEAYYPKKHLSVKWQQRTTS